MTAMTMLRTMLERGRDALPGAWQQDPIFRAAAISLGVTGLLLLARVVGPQLPDLQPQLYNSPVVAPFAQRGQTVGPATSAAAPPAATPVEVPQIAPGHSLSDVTVAPAVDGDRFGTFKPGTRP